MTGSLLAPGAAHDRRQRRLLLGLALLFFAPLAVSFYLYYGAPWRPGGHVNHGDLIDPPRPLPLLSLPLAARGSAAADTGSVRFQSKWTLLYVGAGECAALCRTDLYNMRQVRLALNRDMDRVQRVFIAGAPCCDWRFLDAEHPDLLTALATPAAAPLLALLPAVDGIAPAAADRVYLIDPLGNLMMSYAPVAKPKGMLQDLKRLLGLSHVG
jgi:cytochrome oxidase Cu insertion factor (SCO1/SenC/PrrC family)